MRRIEFLDNVTITRATDNVDDWGNPKMELVYQGKCNYQEGNVVSQGVIIHKPKAYLPELVVVEINDQVDVVTRFGRKITGLVNVPRDIEMPIHKDVKLVELELKQAQ